MTVNAEQAVLADQVVSGRTKRAGVVGFLTTGNDTVMELIDPMQKEAVRHGARTQTAIGAARLIRLLTQMARD